MEHPLAAHEEVTVDELAAYPVTLIGGAAGRGSGFNAAVRRIFAAAGTDPVYREPPDLIPRNALRLPITVSVSVDVGYGAEVRRLRLVGEHRMRYQLVHRADGASPAVLALAAFAARHARGA